MTLLGTVAAVSYRAIPHDTEAHTQMEPEPMRYSIFAIANNRNPMFRFAFITQFKAASPRGNLIPCVGMYKGEHEFSFMCREDDFDAIVRQSGWIDGQESVLHVAGGNKMEAVLEYFDGRPVEGLGCMHEVDREEALAEDAWTYRADIDKYWVARKGNPDKVPASSGQYADGFNDGYTAAVRDSANGFGVFAA